MEYSFDNNLKILRLNDLIFWKCYFPWKTVYKVEIIYNRFVYFFSFVISGKYIFLIGWNAVRPNGDIILWWCSLRTNQQFPKNIKVVGETSIMCRISIRINFLKKLQLYILYALLCTKYTVNSGGSTSQAIIREFFCCP